LRIDTVLVRGRALTQILGYAIEVYKKECTGVLMGDIFETAHKVVVSSAVALQSAERGFSHVDPTGPRYKRVSDVLSFLSLDWILGEFHSHTQWGTQDPSYRLSPEDQEYILNNHYTSDIEIVVALKDRTRTSDWDYIDQTRVLKGTLGDHDIRIAAYYKADEDDTGTMTEIWAPIIEIANMANDLNLAPDSGFIFNLIPLEFHRSRYRKLVRLIRKYEDKMIQTTNPEEGEDILNEIEPLMKEVAAIDEIYGEKD